MNFEDELRLVLATTDTDTLADVIDALRTMEDEAELGPLRDWYAALTGLAAEERQRRFLNPSTGG